MNMTNSNVTCDAATECQTDMHDLITVRYDEADQSLDVLEFVTCALAVMDSTYSDTVVNGCVSTIDDAVAALREYIADTRKALISVSGCPNWQKRS